ncbi:MAG: hypothetical protein HC849_32825 [Oscillatoriales cyanobacterium RU_3_3]|nr:hypothetical protein [Microcoleus sp. SU_5_6]NJL67996.1 hypothetical protein [Microcoleus sp. SM1_3_4]NJM63850.1 hypothetical protein [Oscillatoriales cyanobacterium RU_3_3]NJR21291.1 hypothetical protein [Richelia sp. CSU_2_1]
MPANRSGYGVENPGDRENCTTVGLFGWRSTPGLTAAGGKRGWGSTKKLLSTELDYLKFEI